MTVDPTSTPQNLNILAEVVRRARGQKGDRPPTAAVVQALLQAEETTRQQRLEYPSDALLGEWRLCFVANQKMRQGQDKVKGGWYVPQFAPAQISFAAAEAGRSTIANQVQLGALLLKLTGPANYSGKKNLLAFDFTRIQLSLGSWTIYQGNIRGGQTEKFYEQSIAQLPFFAFFLITDDFIAARGRGGGLALWMRVLAKA
ncbi:MAG TPA: hypothetical protein V6D18_13860 [Thermosynechococcaceae cyanobacterium]